MGHEKTPIEHLEHQIGSYEMFLDRLETGIGVRPDISKERIEELTTKYRGEIEKYRDAINILKDRILPEEKALLKNLYQTLWINAHYDPQSEEIGRFCREPAKILSELNQTMRFKL